MPTLFSRGNPSSQQVLQICIQYGLHYKVVSFTCKAFRIPNAMLLSYNVWQAAIVIFISSLTLKSKRPRSQQFTVTWRIISSKKYVNKLIIFFRFLVKIFVTASNFAGYRIAGEVLAGAPDIRLHLENLCVFTKTYPQLNVVGMIGTSM